MDGQRLLLSIIFLRITSTQVILILNLFYVELSFIRIWVDPKF